MTGHQSDGSSFDEDAGGFYTPACECGWRFGPVPDLETLCDTLMEHAYDRGQQRPEVGLVLRRLRLFRYVDLDSDGFDEDGWLNLARVIAGVEEPNPDLTISLGVKGA